MTTTRMLVDLFGVVVAVEVSGPESDRLLHAAVAYLPEDAAFSRSLREPMATVGLIAAEYDFTVRDAAGGTSSFSNELDAMHAVDRAVREVVSLAAPRHVAVHAGVVRGAQGAIVIPGRSCTGKTTLVGALVAAGASYLSDEYAMVDASGAVWPYQRPLSYRTPAGRCDVSAAVLGRVADREPARVALVVTTSYRPGARWRPEAGTAADAALALVDNAVAAKVRPGHVLAAVSAMARTARHLRGERGDASEMAVALLREVGGPELPRLPVPAAPSPGVTAALPVP